MTNNNLTVILGISKLSVSQKIIRGRVIVDSILNNPSIFINPPGLTAISSAIDDLEIAEQEAADGGKTKTAIMHDKERIVVKLLTNLAHYVQTVADNNEQIVHLASLNVKRPGIVKQKPDFEVFLPDDLGAVGLRCKARPKTLYRWEYTQDPNGAWTVFTTTDVSSTFIGNLQSNVPYWFRVTLINMAGEHVLSPICIAPL